MIPHSKPFVGREEADAAASVIQSGFVGRGPKVREFEKTVAGRLRQRNAVATTSGTAALHLALLVTGVKPGDDVILPAFACRAVLNAVLMSGANPVLADIEADLTISPKSVLELRSAKTRAVIAVHMFGIPARIDALRKLGMPIIEDAASSFGSALEGSPLGSLTDLSIVSFASTKMITTGQGGMLLTSNDAGGRTAKDLIDYDAVPKESGDAETRFNYAMTDIPAATGIEQIRRLDGFIERRRKLGALYLNAIRGSKTLSTVYVQADNGFCPYRFVMQSPRDTRQLVEEFRSAGIDARSGIAHYLCDYGRSPRRFPGVEAIRDKLLSVPIYPALSDAEAERIASVLSRVAT